jgi:hypothetical protein
MCLVTPIITANVCDVSRAGLKVLWAIDCSQVVDLTIDPDSRIVTSISLESGATFKRVEFEKDTAFLNQTKSVNKSSVNYIQQVTIYEAGLSNEVRNALEDLNCVCCLHVIVEDNSGNLWYLGVSYFPATETWSSEDMRTGEGSANTGADTTADSAEYLETFLANTFNYALLTTVDPDTLIGTTGMFAFEGVAFAQDGVAFSY